MDTLSLQIRNMIISNHGSITIHEISKKTGYSVRHITRVFTESFGISPKKYCEQIRFQQVLDAITKNPDDKISNYLEGTSYSDQPHLQREFKKFTGMTPKQYINSIKDKI